MIGSPPGTAGLTGSAACSLSKLFLRVEEFCLFERAEVTRDTNGPISAKEDKSFQKEISKKVADHVQILKLGENVCSVRYCIIEKKSWLQFGWTFAGQQSVLKQFWNTYCVRFKWPGLMSFNQKAQRKTTKWNLDCKEVHRLRELPNTLPTIRAWKGTNFLSRSSLVNNAFLSKGLRRTRV